MNDLVTRTFDVEEAITEKVREELASRVRLTFRERRPFLSPETKFTVTGPQWAVEQVGVLIEKWNLEAWAARQW